MVYSFFPVGSDSDFSTYYYYQSFNRSLSTGIPRNNSPNVTLQEIPSTVDIGSTGAFSIQTLVPNTISSGGILTNVPFISNGDGGYAVTSFTSIQPGFLFVGLRFTHFAGEDLEFSNTSWRAYAVSNTTYVDIHLNDFRSEFTIDRQSLLRINPILVDTLSREISIKQEIIFVIYNSNSPVRSRIFPWRPTANYVSENLVAFDSQIWRSISINTNSTPSSSNSDWQFVGDLTGTGASGFGSFQGFHVGDLYLAGGTRQPAILTLVEDSPSVSFTQYNQSLRSRAIVSRA